MTVCVDTNVLIQARAISHPYGVILDAFAFRRLHWAVSNSVLLEYEEIIASRAGAASWQSVARFIELIDRAGTLIRVHPQYRFCVIGADPDDNAFTDCAISVGADYVITEDRHFAPLANAGYKSQPIAPLEFIARHPEIFR